MLDMGMTYYNNRQVAQQPTSIKNLLPHIVLLKILFTALYILITFAVAYFTHISSDAYPLLMMLCTNQVLLSAIIYLRSNISGLHHFKTDSVLSITDKILMLTFFGSILLTPEWKQSFTIEWFVYGQTACYAATIFIALITTLRISKSIEWHISINELQNIWKHSYPYVLVIFFMTVYTRSDAVILERLLGTEAAGHYAAAYRLLDAANQFGYLFAALLLPIFSRLVGSNKAVKALMQSAFIAISLIASVAVVISIFYSNNIMDLLYHNTISQSGKTLTILMISLWGSFGVYVFGTLLAAAAKLRALNSITATAAVMSICINFILIPRYGIEGAAITTIICNLFVAISEYVYIRNYQKETINLIVIPQLLVFVALLLLSGWILSIYSDVSWIIQCFALIILSSVYAFALRLISIQQIQQLLQLARED